MEEGDGFKQAQDEWISRVTDQVKDLVPEKSHATWRTLVMKIKRTPGTGVELSMRLRNQMGIDRVLEPNAAAQMVAKELHALYSTFGMTNWQILEARFGQSLDTEGKKPPVVTCIVSVDPTTNTGMFGSVKQ